MIRAHQRRHLQSRPPAVHLEDDVVGGFRPDEGPGICVIVFDVVFDGTPEFRYAFEDATTNTIRGDFSEPALDQIQP